MNLVFCKSDFTDSDRWLALLELAGVDVEDADYIDNFSEVVVTYDRVEANC